MAEPRDLIGRFIDCDWECSRCHHDGHARPFARPDENDLKAAVRFARETRQRCVEGCEFHAEPKGMTVHG